MFGLITRRRHEAELAAVRSYCDALRERCETAEKNEAAERVARRTITRQHAELDVANRRLEGRVLELGRRLTALAEADPEYAANLEQRITRLRKAAARYLNALWTARADNRELTQLAVRAAAALEEMETKVRTAEERARLAVQGLRPEEWDARPVDGALRVRQDVPGEELQRALARCRALDQRVCELQAAHVADTRELHDLRQGVAS